MFGERQYRSAFQVAEVEDDQEDTGERISASGQVFRSTTQQELQRTGIDGEVSYVPPTLQLEDGTKRRRRICLFKIGRVCALSVRCLSGHHRYTVGLRRRPTGGDTIALPTRTHQEMR